MSRPSLQGLRSALASVAVAVTLLGLGVSMPISTAHAQVAAPLPGSTNEEEQKVYWQTTYREALDAERAAWARLEAAREVWTRGRRNLRLRGEKRVKALREMTEAEAAWTEARREVEEIPERARRAGIPPGWLREVEEG